MSRKRPAPGASPVGYQQSPQQIPNAYQNGGPGLTDEQFFNWGADGQNPNPYSSPSMYNMPAPAYSSQPTNQPSNQIARRPINQMVPRPQQNDQWASEQAAQMQQQQQQDSATTWSDDIDELVAKAQVAKKEAQAKRKQIPPFVLKLHSFLENPKNTDLIRWADDGKSFVVLNEDEFANKLIPELFKHNNYASFVRQLNMYGFHKKVGLSDNSMRASERKAKSPSEYWNPFFRRGYPDLLWLIQKPKNQTSSAKAKGRGKSEDREDEEEYTEDISSNGPPGMRPQLLLGPESNQGALTQEQFTKVQQELLQIRRQQGQITQMLAALKREHDALVDQANDYHNKHSRHEHSINAILTFLATLYNRSLQNHEGTQDIAKIFAQTLNQDKGGGIGNEQYVFDLPEGTPIEHGQQNFKKPRLLLTDGSENRATTMSPPSTAASPARGPSRRSSHMARSPQSAHVEEIFDADLNNPPSHTYQAPSHQQQQDMMSLIHNTNARNSNNNTPVADFSHVLNNLENTGGTTPVSAAQHDNMLRMFNEQSRRSRPGTSDSNALISPVRTNSQTQFDNRIAKSQGDLEHLAQLQAAQEKSVENLTNLLQPLSPTGSIPGLGDGQDIPPPPLNIDDFLNSAEYFDFPHDASSANLDFANLNNNAYNNNSNTSGFDFPDDDPLFVDVDDKQNADGSFLDPSGNYGAEGHGKVESIASSSDAPTPKQNGNGSETGEWAGNVSKKRRTS